MLSPEHKGTVHRIIHRDEAVFVHSCKTVLILRRVEIRLTAFAQVLRTTFASNDVDVPEAYPFSIFGDIPKGQDVSECSDEKSPR